jgi:hypothetical protein
MFDKTSRYYNVGVVKKTVLDNNGLPHELSYVRRRFIPSGSGLTTLVEHTVIQGDRLDNITSRYLGDPTQFWRVCDANDVLQPTELTDEIGTVITIALPHL